jgi:hypothetical protein
MMMTARALLEAMVAAQREGWGASFVLWVFVLAAVGAAALALRAYRGANEARIDALTERLDDCERKHAQQSQVLEQALQQARVRHDRLQRKLALVTGLLIAKLGERGVPDGLLALILDEDGEGLPVAGMAAAA